MQKKSKKKNNKRTLILMIIALLAVILVVSAIVSQRTPKISDAKKAAIEEVWTIANTWHWESSGTRGCRYYGNFEGYDIVFYPSNTISSAQIIIADVLFEYNYFFELFAFKDGNVYDLKQLYSNNGISADSITEIARLHDGDSENYPPVTDAQKATFEQIWFESERSLRWDTQENEKGTIRYYGKHENYEIFLYVNDVPPNCLSYYASTIATSKFEFDCSCTIYAQQGSSLYRLRDLYNSGGISAKAVEKIAELHEKLSK